MTTDALDPSVVSKPILQQIEQVTCIECCKYYIAPETASCGHSLCHRCWSGRRRCPACAASVNRKSLKLNLHLQVLTDHVHILSEAFEKLFNVKLEEFTLDIAEMQSESDPTKHVKDWLACSENHFSAPVSSQKSQDIVESVELTNSKIQIHAVKQKKESTQNKIKHSSKNSVPQMSQEDWDKIEIIRDTEDISTKYKENIVGPMDIEPFDFEDSEYTSDHPRRSSRKRELKHDSSHKTRELSVEKQSSKNSGSESKKVKQNWSNVKKMRKEFSRLNRNTSKLNVSIEMFKKSQSSAKKPELAVREPSPKACYEIDDNTPNINPENEDDSLFAIKKFTNENNKNKFVPQKLPVKESRRQCASIDESSYGNTKISIDKKNKSVDYDQNHKQRVNLQNRHNDVNENNDVDEKNKFYSQDNVINAKPVNVPVNKKSNLLKKSSEDNSIKITQNDVNPNSVTADNSDNVEISIRIGNTVTNIVIKKKPNDVQINTDREIQTSLGPYNLTTSKKDVSCSPMQVHNIKNIMDENIIEEIKTQPSRLDDKSDDKIVNTLEPSRFNDKTNDEIVNTQSIKPISAKKNTESATAELKDQQSRPNLKTDDKIDKTAINKSTSKKNTESADTSTANFEITESVEKELSDIMDGVETKAKDQDKVSLKSAKEKSTLESCKSKTKKITNDFPEDVQFLNDIDIFNSGSVKEVNVESLQSAYKACSEILVPTMSNKSKKSQKLPDKREREANDEIEMPKNKKQKVDILNRIDEGTSEESRKNVGNDSEHMNYDAIMSQVFANIDADFKTKTQSRKVNSNKPTAKDLEMNSNDKAKANIKLDTEKDKEKYSENIFSVLDKDSEVIDITNHSFKQVEPDSTQRRVENLLTPGMCHDLMSSTRENTQEQEDEYVHMGTPLVDSDDSDKSIVEETPQKNISFTKLKQYNDSSHKATEVNKEKPTVENKILNENNDDLQIIRSIINISDTEESDKLKDTTVINVPNKNMLETPLTINKFVDHIQHNSTPVAKKSLNFDSENIEDLEQTLCPTTTQEKEFMAKAFEQTPKSPAKKPLGLKNTRVKETKKFCLAGSCLTAKETTNLKLLCFNNGWTYVDKYTKEITHLIVGVDAENKSQRSVKYMCALAASKWIVSYGWIEKCLITKQVVDELPFEALDACGEPGPQLSRLAPKILFEGISFYCMSPFGILDIETLKYILEAAGGRVVNNVQGVKVTAGCGPALLLAEPEQTQEDRFIYLAMEQSIVPMNYEWVLNCLGCYSLCCISDLLLCPSTLLPPATRDWPAALMQRDSQED